MQFGQNEMEWFMDVKTPKSTKFVSKKHKVSLHRKGRQNTPPSVSEFYSVKVGP
jgi:hypothetical protein